MKLSDVEKKILMLAMDQVASDGEIAAAASRFFYLLRKRYKNGIDLIKALESRDEEQQPMPAGPNPFQQWQSPFGPSMTRPFGQAAPNPHQPNMARQQAQPPPSGHDDWDDFNATWQEILRKAQEQANAFQRQQYERHAAAFAAQAAANAHAQTKEHQDWVKAQLKKKPSIWDKLDKLFG